MPLCWLTFEQVIFQISFESYNRFKSYHGGPPEPVRPQPWLDLYGKLAHSSIIVFPIQMRVDNRNLRDVAQILPDIWLLQAIASGTICAKTVHAREMIQSPNDSWHVH